MAQNYQIIENSGEKLNNILKKTNSGEFNTAQRDIENLKNITIKLKGEIAPAQVGSLTGVSMGDAYFMSQKGEVIYESGGSTEVLPVQKDNTIYFTGNKWNLLGSNMDEELLKSLIETDISVHNSSDTAHPDIREDIEVIKQYDLKNKGKASVSEINALFPNINDVYTLINSGQIGVEATGDITGTFSSYSEILEGVGLYNFLYLGGSGASNIKSQLRVGSMIIGLYNGAPIGVTVIDIINENIFVVNWATNREATITDVIIVSSLEVNQGDIIYLTEDGWQKLSEKVNLSDYATTSSVTSAISTHNSSSAAHPDIRGDIAELQSSQESLIYYGNVSITPSSDTFFTFTKTSEGEAEVTINFGTSGNIVVPHHCSINNENLTVTSIGYHSYTNRYVTSIILPNTITSIGAQAFYNYINLASIEIPNSVTSIGDYAFEGCSSLTSITIPGSVASIGYNVFDSCTSLTSITILKGVTSIGYEAFSGCSSLAMITIPNSVTSIGIGAFGGCTSLTTITIPDSVISIGNSAFNNCSSLESIVVPNRVEVINAVTFGYCTSLANITIPDSVEDIRDSVFIGCISLTEVYYTGSEEQWNQITIGTENTPLENATIHYNCRPAQVADIDNHNASGTAHSDIRSDISDVATVANQTRDSIKYFGDINITPSNSNYFEFSESGGEVVVFANIQSPPEGEIVIPPRCLIDDIEYEVTEVESFYGCTLITSVVLPNSIESIGTSAFSGCTGITQITIPDSVTSFGEYAFNGCTGLTDIYYSGSQSDWESIEGIEDSGLGAGVTIHYDQRPAQVADIDNHNASYTFNRQFTVTNDFVSIGNEKSEVVIDLADIISEGTDGYLVDLPSDSAAKITWRGTSNIIIPTSQETTAAKAANKYGKVISSMSGTLISLPAGVSYVAGMDLTGVDNVEICSLMRDEYVDEDGYVYQFANPNYIATAKESEAATTSYYRGLVNGSPVTYQSHDDIVPVNLYYNDSGNYNGDSVYSIRMWDAATGVNNNTYYILKKRNAGASNGLEQYASINGSVTWGPFPNIKPTSNDELPYVYITIKDDNNNLRCLKTVSYTEFMLDTEVDVVTMDTAGKIYIKPNANLNISLNGSSQMLINETAAYKNIFALVKMSTATPTKSQTTITNTIRTYAGGKLVFVPGANTFAGAFSPAGAFYTENYNILPSATYGSFNIGETYIGHEGIIKYQIIPSPSTNLGTNTASNGTVSGRSTPFPSVIGTKGALATSGGIQVDVSELFSFKTVYDECTETRTIQRFSDEVLLTEDMITDFSAIPNSSNGAFVKFKLPIISAEDTPATNSSSSVANILQSAYEVKSQDAIEAYTTFDGGDKFAVAFTYPAGVGDAGHALVTLATVYGGGLAELKRGLKNSQYRIKYELATPKYKYNINKLYMTHGETLSFTTATNYLSYKDIILKAPENTEAALNMLQPITTNINDLNYRVENIELTEEFGKIGAGDGVTDDTQAIQNAINQTANVNPTYAREVVLTPGVYRISSPLKMNVENMTLRGEGEVILWATDGNYDPIIRVMAGGCKIENLKIYLAKTNDDVNYTDNETDPWLWGYTKSYKESANSNAEGNGHYSGIYVDTGLEYDGEGNYGFFNLTVRDVTVQGAFRYSTKFIEKSYGIYFPKTGYCYFNTIDNCLFNSVMCGLFLGSGATPTDVNCKFDVGDDIYNTGASGNADTFQFKSCYNVMGCRYGAIVYSISNTIRIDGQSIGGDSMNPYVYDNNNREVPLDENTPAAYRVPNSQAYEYDAITHTFVEISGGTVSGFPKNVGEWRKVTDAGIVVHGRLNKIEGMIFDHQRTTYGAFYLSSSSSNCLYNSYSSGGVSYGRAGISWKNHMYIPVEKDGNNKFIKWAAWDDIMSSIGVTDCGLANRDLNTNMLENDHKFGAGVISSVDKYGFNYAFPRTIDKTDDVAAYADKIGDVKCYYVNQSNVEEEITQFFIGHPSNNITTSDISPLFRPNCNISDFGISTGITFGQIPSSDHPIIIEINFGQKPIMGISSGIIRFNQFIGQEVAIATYPDEQGRWRDYYNLFNQNANGEFFWNMYNHNGYQEARKTIEKIRIKLGSAYMPLLQNAVTYSDGQTTVTYAAGTNYNPSGYVGISKIFIGDTNGGGRAFLTRSGGDVYGDINASGILESKSGTIKLGNTTLTEQQLQSLLAIIS